MIRPPLLSAKLTSSLVEKHEGLAKDMMNLALRIISYLEGFFDTPHGADGFTSFPKEGVLWRIFSSLETDHPRPVLNPLILDNRKHANH
jgi:hypothetical protein